MVGRRLLFVVVVGAELKNEMPGAAKVGTWGCRMIRWNGYKQGLTEQCAMLDAACPPPPLPAKNRAYATGQAF